MKWQPTSKKRKEKRRRALAKGVSGGGDALGELLRAASAPPLILAQAEAVHEILGERPTQSSVREAALRTAEVGEAVLRRHLVTLPPETPIACGEGCSWCCHLRVEVSVPEIAWLADFLRRTRGAEELEALRLRATSLAADPRVMSKDGKPAARIPCVLLESKRCSAYEARPLACRGCTSHDVESCQRALDDPDEVGTSYDPQLQTFMSMMLGMLRGARASGLGTEILELTSGLAIALSESNAIERWIAGEPVFDAARVDTSTV